MLEPGAVLHNLRSNYAMNFENIEFNRDGGSISYTVYADKGKFFLRVIRPELMHTALQSIDIHLYLADRKFPVPEIVLTKNNEPFIKTVEQDKTYLYVLYAFIEGQAPESEDAENVGKLVGRFHSIMQGYTGKLVVRDKYFFIDRYIEILRKKRYPKADAFSEYGNALWEKVKDLPRGYCHCDLYRGNVLKAKDGSLYILDFDTSCNAFPIYDVVLFCNETDFFEYKYEAYQKTKETLMRFLTGYLSCNTLSKAEIESFLDLLAVYHFQVQATIMEIYGLDCVNNEFLDQQLDWLLRWQKQCEQESS